MDSTPALPESLRPVLGHRTVINYTDLDSVQHSFERFDLPEPNKIENVGKRFTWRIQTSNHLVSFLRITDIHKAYEQDVDYFKQMMRQLGWLYLGSKTLQERDAQPPA